MAQPHWAVVKVRANDDYTLDISFADGKMTHFDMSPYLETRPFSPLKNMELFKRARVECASVVWSDDIDIAPEFLYEHCKDAKGA